MAKPVAVCRSFEPSLRLPALSALSYYFSDVEVAAAREADVRKRAMLLVSQRPKLFGARKRWGGGRGGGRGRGSGRGRSRGRGKGRGRPRKLSVEGEAVKDYAGVDRPPDGESNNVGVDGEAREGGEGGGGEENEGCAGEHKERKERSPGGGGVGVEVGGGGGGGVVAATKAKGSNDNREESRRVGEEKREEKNMGERVTGKGSEDDDVMMHNGSSTKPADDETASSAVAKGIVALNEAAGDQTSEGVGEGRTKLASPPIAAVATGAPTTGPGWSSIGKGNTDAGATSISNRAAATAAESSGEASKRATESMTAAEDGCQVVEVAGAVSRGPDADAVMGGAGAGGDNGDASRTRGGLEGAEDKIVSASSASGWESGVGAAGGRDAGRDKQ